MYYLLHDLNANEIGSNDFLCWCIMNTRESDFLKSNNSFTTLLKDTTITTIIIIKSWHIDKFYCKLDITDARCVI